MLSKNEILAQDAKDYLFYRKFCWYMICLLNNSDLRRGPTFCWASSGSKLLPNFINGLQTLPLAGIEFNWMTATNKTVCTCSVLQIFQGWLVINNKDRRSKHLWSRCNSVVITVLRIIKLNQFPVPVRLRSGYGKLKFCRYFIMFAIFKNVVHSFEHGETTSNSASHQAPNYAQRS